MTKFMVARRLGVALALVVITLPAVGQTPPQVGASSTNAGTSDLSITEPSGSLTLGVALGLTLSRNPELIAFDWRVRSAEARYLQAGLLPNPEIEVTTENFGGRGDLLGFRGAESRGVPSKTSH